jgi:hypothetical protein
VPSLPPDKAEKPTQGLVVFYLSLHEKYVMEIVLSMQVIENSAAGFVGRDAPT